MRRLAKAFFDIAMWKQTPAYLPASSFLLALVVCAAVLLEVMGSLLPPSSLHGIFPRIILSVGLPLGFTWALLSLAKRPQRFLQTGVALLGVSVLADLVFYPLSSMLRFIGADRLLAIPVACVLCVAFIWYLLAGAHIWRCALDSGLLLGGVISVGYFLFSTVLELQLLPQT